jgi:hypothetical protein
MEIDARWLLVSDQERCPIFPSMLKAYCSHCQGTARGTPGNPKFSLKEGIFKGFPVVEVLRDGAAIHPWDDHFRFGRRKAEMLLACIELPSRFLEGQWRRKRSLPSSRRRESNSSSPRASFRRKASRL